MDEKQRNKRLRLLLKRLNKERKVQAKKIDILCNDLIAAQRDFISRLNTVSFTAEFYKSIVAAAELGSLLSYAGKLIEGEVPDANVAFFLRQGHDFELHLFESERPITLDKQSLENCFSSELVENICKSNKVCVLEDMFAMGLEGNLTMLNGICAVTIPLCRHGLPLGFILIYRCWENEITTDELKNICAVTPGLSRAIVSCSTLCHSSD